MGQNTNSTVLEQKGTQVVRTMVPKDVSKRNNGGAVGPNCERSKDVAVCIWKVSRWGVAWCGHYVAPSLNHAGCVITTSGVFFVVDHMPNQRTKPLLLT